VGGIERSKAFRQHRIYKNKTEILYETKQKTFTNLITDEEWEKDLAAEIQDFEVVDDQNVDESDLDLDLK
jgi:hypothetical protein